VRQNRPTGHFSRRVREKNKNKNKNKKRLYFLCIWPNAPLRPICTKFGLIVCLMDVINSARLYRDRLRGFINNMLGMHKR